MHQQWSYCSLALNHRHDVFIYPHNCYNVYVIVLWLTMIWWHLTVKTLRPRFNIKMSSYQYKKSHCGHKIIVRSSYLNNGISNSGKMKSLYWIRARIAHSWESGVSCTFVSLNSHPHVLLLLLLSHMPLMICYNETRPSLPIVAKQR